MVEVWTAARKTVASKREDGWVKKAGKGVGAAGLEVEEVIGEAQDDDRGVDVRKRDGDKGARSTLMLALGGQGHEEPESLSCPALGYRQRLRLVDDEWKRRSGDGERY